MQNHALYSLGSSSLGLPMQSQFRPLSLTVNKNFTFWLYSSAIQTTNENDYEQLDCLLRRNYRRSRDDDASKICTADTTQLQLRSQDTPSATNFPECGSGIILLTRDCMAIPEASGPPRRRVPGAYTRQNKGDPGAADGLW